MDKKVKEQIENMKKVVLHLHLDGSLRPETVYNWLVEQGEDVTLEQVQNALMVERDCRDLNEYLQKFDLPCRMLQTEGHMEQATYELFEDLAKQNVIYAEVRFAPSKHLEKGLNYNEVVEAAIKGMERAKKEFGIKGNLILCAMRGKNKEKDESTVEVAKEYLNKGVCALDLAGDEENFPTSDYKNIFDEATNFGIPYTIHAGEADGINSMKAAIDFGAKRIGHGVAIANYFNCLRRLEQVQTVSDLKSFQELKKYSEIKELLKLDDETEILAQIREIINTFNGVVEDIKRKQIGLEVCPKSNYDTKTFGNDSKLIDYYKAVELLYKKGFKVTINPDNSTVSSIEVNTELENLYKYTDLTLDDIAKIQTKGSEQCFVTCQKQKDSKTPDTK